MLTKFDIKGNKCVHLTITCHMKLLYHEKIFKDNFSPKSHLEHSQLQLDKFSESGMKKKCSTVNSHN